MSTERHQDEAPSMSNAIAELMAGLGETLAPIAEAAVGARAQLEREHGYSPTMAEHIAGTYHAAMMKGMVEIMIATQVKEIRK